VVVLAGVDADHDAAQGFKSLSLAGVVRFCVAIRLRVVVGEIDQTGTWTALRRDFCSSSYHVTACPLMEAHQCRPTVRAKGTEPHQPRVSPCPGVQPGRNRRAAVDVEHARKSTSILQLSHCRKGNFWIINYAHWSQGIGQRITLLFPDDHCPAAAVQASRAGEPGT
jgi:hypothetical protein